MKKKMMAGLLAVCITLGCFGGCGVFGGDSSTGGNGGDPNVFAQVLSEQSKESLSVGAAATYDINKDITDKNYVKLTLTSEVRLLGAFIYSDVKDATKVVEEEFFIEAADGKIEFKQFLDAFRPNGIGCFDKILKQIRLTNVDAQAGEVQFLGAYVSGREIPSFETEQYITNGTLKVGADLMMGGSLTYLERMNYRESADVLYTVDEILTTDGEVQIGVNAKNAANCAEVLSSSVNLINIYDPGRQIQQSYYANVGGTIESTNGENGYDRGWCFTGADEGYYWPYNPVQAGDCGDNPSQIIDYEVSNNRIWVKVRPMDWGKAKKAEWTNKYNVAAAKVGGEENLNVVQGGVTTKSYMENVYRLAGSMLYVDNSFVDWNGFSEMETIPVHTNELPATFVVHPFSKFVTYSGMFPWSGDTNLTEKEGEVSHYRAESSEDWFAWVNEENFGVGVYTPNVDYYASNRTMSHSFINGTHNAGAFGCPTVINRLYNKPYPVSNYTSAYVFNLSYTAPVVSWSMKEYTRMNYQYALTVDYVDMIRTGFKNIYESGEMTNESFSEWK